MTEGRKFRLWHEMRRGDALIATGEHMMIHVDLATRAACLPGADVAAAITALVARHAKLPIPEGVGRFVGQAR
jgi:carnitine 3-dehydrogenase